MIRRIISARALRIAAGYALGGVCLFWVFHDTDWKTFLRNIEAINWFWAALGVLASVLSFVVHGFRWRLLLKPLGRIHVLRTTQAVYCGILVNDILPMSFGEITRAYVVSVCMHKDFFSIIPSVILERVFEAVWLAVGIGITALNVPLPKDLRRAADVFGAIVLLLVGLVLAIALRKKRARREKGQSGRSRRKRLGRWLSSFLERLGDGFRSIGLSRDLAFAFLLSLLLFTFQIASLWFFIKAYGLRLSFPECAAVYFITLLGTALPIAPASIGTYQFFCVVALTLFGVGKTNAAGFSLVAYLFMTMPLLAVGIFALSKSGMTLSDLRERISRLRLKRRPDPRHNSSVPPPSQPGPAPCP